MSSTLEQLQTVLIERKQAAPDSSYVASLYNKGLNKILEKVGEEATEVILAAKDCQSPEDIDHLAEETADLWFHTLVMLAHLNVDVQAVLSVLEKRFGLSGLAEKAARNHNQSD